MRKVFILCAALFSLSLGASAQDSTVSYEPTPAAAEPAAPASLIPADREPWQLGVGFEYLKFDALGQNFHNFGYQGNVTRYLNNWFGIEGTAIAGFGHDSNNSSIEAKSIFLGGGPHIVFYSNRHLEPWGHVIGGWERFRFTQSGTFGTNSHAAFLAGAGLDYKISNGRLYWRVQGDFLGTNISGPSVSKNYAIGTGFVLNF
jgi:hypothetical protein